MIQPDFGAILNHDGGYIIKAANPSPICDGFVLDYPDIVAVLVRIQSDLLLLASGRVHVSMGVKVSALGIPMPNGDMRAESYICWYGGHSLIIECRLKLARHESITVTRVDEAHKVNCKHRHIEANWDDDKAESACKEVLKPKTLQWYC